jgi:hypothetical protein
LHQLRASLFPKPIIVLDVHELIHFWEKWSKNTTFGKSGAKTPLLGKVEQKREPM